MIKINLSHSAHVKQVELTSIPGALDFEAPGPEAMQCWPAYMAHQE